MSHPTKPTSLTSDLSRRDLMHWGTRGLGATALLNLLCGDGTVHGATATASAIAGRPIAHFTPRARRAIHISLVGGLSHIDSFDYKPNLPKFHGKKLDSKEKPDIFFGKVGLIRQPDWAFRQRGNSGLWMSELFPHIAERADDLAIIRTMVSDSANHTPALFMANSGFQFQGFPAMGSWLGYGLGTETDSLPTFVVLGDGRGGPNGGAANWSNGFLPAEHQGVVFGSGDRPVRDLFPSRRIDAEADKAARAFMLEANQRYRRRTGADPALDARIRSYELAAKMQMSVPEVTDMDGEPQWLREQYGLNDKATEDMGRRCLLGRRLLEKGVRYVQVYSGGPIAGSPRTSWDAHEDVAQNHGAEAKRIDQPVAALLRDLKQRGMLEDTLVLFTTEFGRTPFTQAAGNTVGKGRDHNRYAFSNWIAGAGVRPGVAYGETDDIGWKVAEDPVHWHDFHATILHLFGVDHERLTYYHNGIERRLTNVHGEVVSGVVT